MEVKTTILANGFRAANGVCLNPDGSFFVTDQEGHWNPMNRINRVTEGGFYGNMYGYGAPNDSSDDAMEQPLCWPNKPFDRSPSELLWVDSDAWGPLNGSLLNLSYGYGKVYVVPHEQGRWSLARRNVSPAVATVSDRRDASKISSGQRSDVRLRNARLGQRSKRESRRTVSHSIHGRTIH